MGNFKVYTTLKKCLGQTAPTPTENLNPLQGPTDTWPHQ